MTPATPVEPMASHPLGGDELEKAESAKAKEAGFGNTEEVAPAPAVATATPAEGTNNM